jgi:hypothetical protein
VFSLFLIGLLSQAISVFALLFVMVLFWFRLKNKLKRIRLKKEKINKKMGNCLKRQLKRSRREKELQG